MNVQQKTSDDSLGNAYCNTMNAGRDILVQLELLRINSLDTATQCWMLTVGAIHPTNPIAKDKPFNSSLWHEITGPLKSMCPKNVFLISPRMKIWNHKNGLSC